MQQFFAAPATLAVITADQACAGDVLYVGNLQLRTLPLAHIDSLCCNSLDDLGTHTDLQNGIWINLVI